MPEDHADIRFTSNTGDLLQEMPNQLRVGVSAVILNQGGEILLERRADNGYWGLPGGGVDIGESVTHAIKREVMEETSLAIAVKRLVGIYSDPLGHNISVYPDGNIVQWVSICFLCEILSGDMQMSEESIDLAYFQVESLPDNLMIAHRIRIEDALKNADLPFVK